MLEAIKQAKKAGDCDEVPIGAVVVKDGKIIARAYNKKNAKKNALLHAEIIALNKAQKNLGDWHLYDCDLYVTLEPCPMCAGACINTRVRAIYFGAYDQKAGCCATLYNLPSDTRFNHRPIVQGGIMAEECATLLTQFFKAKRGGKL